jgi:hypothetical protein
MENPAGTDHGMDRSEAAFREHGRAWHHKILHMNPDYAPFTR